MLEAYQAWGDQRSIGALMRNLYLGVADALGSRVVETPMSTSTSVASGAGCPCTTP